MNVLVVNWQRPHKAFFLHDLWNAHCKAIDDGNLNFIDSACLMRHYGYPLYTIEGSPENIKITTPSDFYTFRALEDARENSQIFG
ncbi:MAG: 2-C-methyl-D-erythritol 4-phosphate cytidylyltransferase [Faecalibacterium prausnitzii]